MKPICLFFYYIIIKNLPNSSFPLGKFINKIRIALVKKIFPIGKNCKLQKNVYFGNGKDISIGNYCQINENIKLDNVKIGNYVMIARNTTFLGKMHEYKSREIPMILQGEKETTQTIVEDDVWIGANAIIMPGIIIKKGTIIGAGAVLTKSTDCYSIYAGVPAKKIKER